MDLRPESRLGPKGGPAGGLWRGDRARQRVYAETNEKGFENAAYCGAAKVPRTIPDISPLPKSVLLQFRLDCGAHSRPK